MFIFCFLINLNLSKFFSKFFSKYLMDNICGLLLCALNSFNVLIFIAHVNVSSDKWVQLRS